MEKMKNTIRQVVDYPVVGMSCASCAARIGQVLSKQPGIYEANVNYASSSVHISYNPELFYPQQWREVVRGIGYDLLCEKEEAEIDEVEKIRLDNYYRLQKRTLVAMLLWLPLLVMSLVGADLPLTRYLMAILSAFIVFGLGHAFSKIHGSNCCTARLAWIRW